MLTTINEDDTTNDGNTVAEIIVDNSITEPADGSPIEAIAVTIVDHTKGRWEYSTNNGASWNVFSEFTGSTYDIENEARLLDGTLTGGNTHRIRFVPAVDENGSATFTFRAWDKSSGAAGSTADASITGGITAFSVVTDTAVITINAVNDAPMFTLSDNVTVDEDFLVEDSVVVTPDPPPFDEGGQVVTYNLFPDSISFADVAIDSNTGRITITSVGDSSGNQVFTVTATDDGDTTNGGITTYDQLFILTVNAVNDAPIVTFFYPHFDTLIYTGVNGIGEAIAIVSVYDFDSDCLTFDWQIGVSSYDTVICNNDVFVDTLIHRNQPGEYHVNLTVTDNGENVEIGESDTTRLSITDSTIFKIGQPSVSTSSNQVFVVDDTTRFFSPLIISNGQIDSTINELNGLRICFPNNSPIKWVDTSSISFIPDTLIQLDSISSDSTQLVFDVLSDFYSSDTVKIIGIKVTGFSDTVSFTQLRLIVDGDGRVDYDYANAQDSLGYWIGTPSIALNPDSVSNNYLVVNNLVPDSNWTWKSQIILKNGEIDSTFHKGDTLRIKIPDGLNLEWTGEPSGYDTTKLKYVNEDSNEILALKLKESFLSGDTITLNVQFRQLAPSSYESLRLDVIGIDIGGIGPTFPVSSSDKLTVGDPSISSGTNQVFVVGDNPQVLKPIRYMEDGVSPTLKGHPNIYLKIPTDMNLFWQSSLNGDSIQVSNQAGYSVPIDSSRLLDSTLLHIALSESYMISNWTKNDTLVINNLKIDGFLNPTKGPTSFSVSVLDTNHYHDCDTHNIQVGRPRLVLSENHTFLYNDIDRPLNSIIIYEDSLAVTITKQEGIILILPGDFPSQWKIPPDSLHISGTYKGYIDSLEIYGKDTLELFLSKDFAANDSLVIKNLMVGKFEGTYYKKDSCFKMSVNQETINFPHYSNDSTKWVQVGKPEIRMAGDMILLYGNNNSVKVPQITIKEDQIAPVINPARRYLTLGIPDSMGINWDTSVPVIQLDGNTISPIPLYNERFVGFEILEDFRGNDTICINGLYLRPPTASVDAYLTLSLNNGLTDCGGTVNRLRIGSVSFSSESNQFFFKKSNERELNNITITQDTTVSLIDSLIILKIPNSLKVKWDSVSISNNIEFTINGNTLNAADLSILYNHSHKTIHIMNPTLNEADNITIKGMYFRGIGGELLEESSEDTLRMSLRNVTNSLVLTDSMKKTIGGPSVVSSDNSALIIGESGTFACIDTIIIREDESIPVLSQFDSVKIIIPNEIGSNFKWNNTLPLYIDSDSISADYQDKSVTVPLNSNRTRQLSSGDSLRLWGLGFNEITEYHSGFNLEFQFVSESIVPNIKDNKEISSGSLSIDMLGKVENLMGTSLHYPLPEITISEDTTKILGKKRALVLILSEELQNIADWYLDDIHVSNGNEIDRIEIKSDSLKLFFNDKLSTENLTLSGLSLTIREIYGNDITKIHADSLEAYFTAITGMIQMKSIKSDVFNPMLIDTTINNIEFFPPVILEKPKIYNRSGITIISFVTSPGMVHPDSILLPSMFQLIRTWPVNDDTILFTDTSNSLVSIDSGEWVFNDSITVQEMPFVNISLAEGDLWTLNRWFDEISYYNQLETSTHYINVDKANTYLSEIDATIRVTDSSSICWSHYNPAEIFFNQRNRIVYSDTSGCFELNLNLGNEFPDSIEIILIGKITAVDTTISFSRVDSTLSLGSVFTSLSDDLYTLRMESWGSTNNGMVPVIRQFIVDNKQPEILEIEPKTGRSKSGGGHEVSRSEVLNLYYWEDLSVIKDSTRYFIQFSSEDTVLSTDFPFSDSLELTINMDWSKDEDLSYGNQSLKTFDIARSQGDSLFWSLQIDSLLLFLLDDSSQIVDTERLNAKIIFSLSDHTINKDSMTVEYVILINTTDILGSEVFNYPNPFSVLMGEKTNIRYVINKEGLSKGKFIVFDAGGDVVYYNRNIDVSIGTHTDLVWDGTDLRGNRLSSGIYFGYLEIENKKPVRIKIAILNR